MKGPGVRLDLDVRRVWECPQCGKRRRALGDVTAMRCTCSREEPVMLLREGQRVTRSFVDVIERVQRASESNDPHKKSDSRETEQQPQEPPPQSERVEEATASETAETTPEPEA